MKVELADRLEAVGATAWDRLHAGARFRSPFLSWIWQTHWASAFAADRRLDIRRVTDGEGSLVAVLPLYEEAPGVFQMLGGIRAGMGYLGCRNIGELQKKARFMRISQAGLRESHVHDVIITQEAPNYRVES